MTELELRMRLHQEMPEVPEMFHRAVTDTLARLADEKEQRPAPPPVRRVLLVAALIVLVLAAAAAATMRWQIFEGLWPFAGSPKAADTVMQSHLAQVTVNGVEITVEEAGYDGRSLLLVYSYRMPDVDTPLGMQRDGSSGEGIAPEDMQLLADRNVGWWIDHIWIDGKAVDMPANSYGDSYGSGIPGKLTERQIYRLDNEGIGLEGIVEIALPIGERQPVSEYSRREHPERYGEDGTLLLPEKGMVTFTLDTAKLPQPEVVKPGIPLEMEEMTAAVAEAVFSPIMTYITLEMQVAPQALESYKAQHGEGFYDGEGNLIYAYDGAEIAAPWLFSLKLVDSSGRVVAEGGGNNGYGASWAEFIYPAGEELPRELWLAPVEAGLADMSRAVRVR